jgi:hypothetical protein
MEQQTRTDWRKFRKSTHLASADLEIMQTEGRSMIFRIKEVKREHQMVNGVNTEGEFCQLEGVVKQFKLNTKNKKQIAVFAVKNGIAPEDKNVIEYWSGLHIELYIDHNVRFGSDIVDGIRIKPLQPVIKKVLAVFQEVNFEPAHNAKASVETIKKHYSVTPEMEQKYIQYVRANTTT